MPSDYPRAGNLAAQLTYCLRYAILAPSAQNAQPWLFRVVNDTVEIIADRSRGLAVIDPNDRQLLIGCGAALYNLRIALRRFGIGHVVELLPSKVDPDLLAVVRPRGEFTPVESDHAMFDSITARRTNRKPFLARPVSAKISDELAMAARHEGAWFVRLLPDQKIAAATLIAEGDRLQLADRRFRRELSMWTAPNPNRRDGIPSDKQGFGPIAKHAAPLIVRTFDRGNGVAANEQELATNSPVLAVFGTDSEDEVSWLSCGMALESVLLRATVHGISTSYLNQPLEREELRPKFAEIAGRGPYPQLIVRMGFGPKTRPTPRRPLEDVLLPVES